MRYFHERTFGPVVGYGKNVRTNHPLYKTCTIYEERGLGLAVIQQYFNSATKHSCWGMIADDKLRDIIYMNPNFPDVFSKRAGMRGLDGYFPTITLRQLMWALRMKPLPKERWETVFDRRDI